MKKRWFRFHIDRWRNGTFGMPPAVRVVYLEILIELYDREGRFRLDEAVMARRCELRPSSFRKALDELVRLNKVAVDNLWITSGSVVEEINERSKVGEKSFKSRRKVGEKSTKTPRKKQ